MEKLNIYMYLDYREWLSDELTQLKKTPGWTKARLANSCGIQPPYFSRVLKKNCHLNSDQLFAITDALDFDKEKARFALLLLEMQRTQNKIRKSQLQQEIEVIRKKKSSIRSHINKDAIEETKTSAQYYLNPELRLIYGLLAIGRYQKKPTDIATCLHIPVKKLNALLDQLMELGFITEKNGELKKTKRRFHLDKNSFFFDSAQQLMKQKVLLQQQLLPKEKQKHFDVIFSADAKAKEKINHLFLEFLSSVEAVVDEAPSEELFQMQFDFFQWS